ncbi:SDR family NAD(P)-dependent oxidoreductase [Sneathiella chungangensis]|nr:SDR family oxidoreductase [Sneathiella chungangensis]
MSNQMAEFHNVEGIAGLSGVEGKVVLITGGTSGVGLRSAEILATAGAKVVVNGRSTAGGNSALERLRELSPESYFERGDLNIYDDVRQVVKNTVERLGGIDILISAGAEGLVGPRPFSEMSVQDIEDTFRTRFYPRIFPVHAALPAFRERGSGSIVMLTTDAARHPTPGEGIVGAAGASVILVTKSFAKEFARWNIRVNTVAMTITSDTPSWDRIFSKEGFSSKLFEKAISRFPSGRPPNANEVAQVVTFLASNGAAQVNGQTISVNGGLSFGGW